MACQKKGEGILPSGDCAVDQQVEEEVDVAEGSQYFDRSDPGCCALFDGARRCEVEPRQVV